MDYKMPLRPNCSHKGTFGTLLNISGSDYMPGAAYLSCEAALRVGCGKVVLCSTDRVISSISIKSSDIVFAPRNDVKKYIGSADAVLIGCGLSCDEKATDFFMKLLELDIDVPVVIDADGINIMSKYMPIRLPKSLVLTPHVKEASRLLGVDTDKILDNMEFYAREISSKYNCITVLKSSKTVICSAELSTEVYDKENSALAHSGSGDVLAGIISGLITHGCDSLYATRLGVYLHGLAGEYAKNDLTEYSTLASDLVRYIHLSIKSLL